MDKFIIKVEKLSDLYTEDIAKVEQKSYCFLSDALIDESKSNEIKYIILRIGNGYCNTNCDYCYVDFSRYDNNKSIKEYIKDNRSTLNKRLNLMLESFEFAENIEVTFLPDSEPLLFQELLTDTIKLFLEKFDKERVSFQIITNGSITLSKDFISIFSLTKKIIFQVSYDGCPYFQEKHRKISTKKVLDFIEKLRKYKINYKIHSVISTFEFLGKEHKVAIFCHNNFYDSNKINLSPVYIPPNHLNEKKLETMNEKTRDRIFTNLYFYFSLAGLLDKTTKYEVSSYCLMNKKLYYSLEDEDIYYCDFIKDTHTGKFIEALADEKYKPLRKGFVRGRFKGDSIEKYDNEGIFLKKAKLIKEMKDTKIYLNEQCKNCPLSKACISYLSCPKNFLKDYEGLDQECLLRRREYWNFISSLYLEKRAFPILFRDRKGNLSIKGYQYTLPLKEEILSVNFSLFSTDKDIFFFKINSSSETAKKRLNDLIKEYPESVFISLNYSEELLDYFDSNNVILPKSPREAINYLQLRELNNKNEFEVLSNDVPIKTISYNPDESVVFLE